MLLDELMPRFDVVERHATIVRASPSATFAAIRAADLTGGPVTRSLLAARALPAVIVAMFRSPSAALAEHRARRTERDRAWLGLAPFERAGFRVLAERAPDELLIGLMGKFWTPRGAIRADVSEAHFAAGPPAGFALAGWNFTVAGRPDGTCELRTETRVRCAPDVRTKFRLYWVLVRPGSGLIRRAMLRAIRRTAEQSGRAVGQPSHNEEES